MALSNAQRRERRKQMAQMVANTQDVASVITYFGVSRRTVQWACMEFGIDYPDQYQPKKTPLINRKGVAKPFFKERKLRIAEDLKNGMSIQDCADKYGVTAQTIYNVRREHNIPSHPEILAGKNGDGHEDEQDVAAAPPPPVVNQLAIKRAIEASIRLAANEPAEEWHGVTLWRTGELEQVWGVGEEYVGQNEDRPGVVLFKCQGWAFDGDDLETAISDKIKEFGDTFWFDVLTAVCVGGCVLRSSGIIFRADLNQTTL